MRPLIDEADPGAILRIKVIDPAMGSGHFLVEACRFLADALYEASRRCDLLGTEENAYGEFVVCQTWINGSRRICRHGLATNRIPDCRPCERSLYAADWSWFIVFTE